jgi:hypothetical protein
MNIEQIAEKRFPYKDTRTDYATEEMRKIWIDGYNYDRWIPVSDGMPFCYQKGDWDGERSDLIIAETVSGKKFTAYCYSGFMDGQNFFDWAQVRTIIKEHSSQYNTKKGMKTFKQTIEDSIELYNIDAAAKACDALCDEKMHNLLVWYQGKGDAYRRNTLLVDVVKDFKNQQK